MQNAFASLKRLSDAELITRVKALAARERGATALLVAHLAELDTRDVLLREGYASLFAYCRDALQLSEHEALNRIEAACLPNNAASIRLLESIALGCNLQRAANIVRIIVVFDVVWEHDLHKKSLNKTIVAKVIDTR